MNEEIPIQVIIYLWISSLHRKPGLQLLYLLSTHSFAIKIAYTICIPLMKVVCCLSTKPWMTFPSLSANSSAMN
uniref:Putative ovule protein n=1 Tax=Solanum chacoense TaxID=4108 RepID=A0A0V0I1S8_SOLCH